ncbi:early protein [Human papillomavirus type 26]|uniref:Protein E7 n=3 Tax=Human papillomavirus type 26 TaxID=333762 RepID=VE7_HPV26|nr:early protein [Human papillomavirus type 26]P36824.1 RecName: Full=Protein E7 [Human papillomavirus type 26]WBM84033.1 E7 protein [Alphapapillomavirus 5]AHY96041.1 early protein E7 [Human papillomavirus type 26]AHY96048.1 early protein E7 [Human papillomavirus type 26]AHY96055.1 early protein E7 [Human papillomavirus type 26]CAA52531.1 early protein [Human papillomavirus type 26]
MHGNIINIEDVILDLVPQPEIDLRCYEQLDYEQFDSSDEDETDNMRDQQARQAGQEVCYRIEAQCCMCNSIVQLAVQSSRQNVRVLEQMLMEDVSLVCHQCAAQ